MAFRSCINDGVSDDVSTTADPLLAIVADMRERTELLEQQVRAYRDANEHLTRERDELRKQVDFFLRELERLRDQQKTGREHVCSDQMQLVFTQLADALLNVIRPEQPESETEPPPPNSPPDPKGNKRKKPVKDTPHGRRVLPEHLPVETLILKPKAVPPNAAVLGEEVSFRLGFRPASFIRLKIVRPIYVVPEAMKSQCEQVEASLVQGDVSVRASKQEREVDAPADGAAPNGASPEKDAVASVPDVVLAGVSSVTVTDDERELTIDAVDVGNATTVVYAPAPDEIIPRGLPTVDLLAHFLAGKFAYQLPFHRQEGMFQNIGVSVSRGTMCGWLKRATELAKHIVDAMVANALCSAAYIATDATGVLVQANERCKNGHFWVLVAEREHVVYRYSARHSSDEPKKFFKGYKGTLIADASSVYDALYRLPDGPTEAGCNSHARRYFFKAIPSDHDAALVGVAFFNKLFEIERDLVGMTSSERLAERQRRSAPVVAALERWRDEMLQSNAIGERTPLRRALNYLNNHWAALTRFLVDGRIPISNNRSELELRRLVVGRANWLFVGSDESAEWTCTFVSLVASCKLHGLDPESYLRDILRLLPVWPKSRMLELSPAHFARTRVRLDQDELRLPLGPITVPPRL